MYPSGTMPKLMVRLPADVKEWIAKEARRNSSSQNSEIIRSIRDRMERETAAEHRASETRSAAA